MIERRRDTGPVCCVPTDGPPSVLALAGEPESASAARRFVREFVPHHAPYASEDYVETVVLVACEIVTNSIRYGTEPGDSLQLTLDTDYARTRVEVQDPVRRRPQPRPAASQQRDRGRGLIILDALCNEWGVTDASFGKTVWAEVKAW
ncbi:ATP-binding protein [Streptomyces sp. TRM70350]|uniref:ATP-binding protein n=1 Tax=Streptomyces sp. TRM70350 TaxID=2856165 RepID=UPI001C489A54|nr:ATP-binding protein [Streptomyces sp. TRM70350]MBV7698747.1 ATP-binding protein [Streptomyces sp. TRM70350]